MNEVWWVTCPSGAANKGVWNGDENEQRGWGKRSKKGSKKGPGKKKKKRVQTPKRIIQI